MLLKDSRNTKSVTLTLLIISWIAITIKFMFGVDGGLFNSMTGIEYAAAMSPFLTAFGFRESQEKKNYLNLPPS